MPIPVIAQRGQIWNSVLLFPGRAPRLGSYGGACRPSLVRCPRARPPCCALSCAELLSPECPEVRKKADSPDSVTPCFWLFRGCFWLFLAVSGLFWAVLGCFSLLFAVFAVLSRLFGCSRLFMAVWDCLGLFGAVFGRFRPREGLKTVKSALTAFFGVENRLFSTHTCRDGSSLWWFVCLPGGLRVGVHPGNPRPSPKSTGGVAARFGFFLLPATA